ncbi:MAG: anti-sigma factor [Pseudomonadota bacterium]
MSESDDLPPLSAETAPLYAALAVDGALDEAMMDRLAEFMAADPSLVTLYDAMIAQDDALPGALAGVAAAPMPLSLAAAAAAGTPAAAGDGAPEAAAANRNVRPARWSNGLAAIIGMLFAAGLGSIIAYQAGRDTAEVEIAAATGWVAQVAQYHKVYAQEGRHLVEVPASDIEHIRTWLSNRVGRPVAVPDFSDAGFEFAGARLLVAGGRPVAQLMYTQAGGTPVGYCIIASAGDDTDVALGEREGLGFARWREGEAGHIVIGEEAPELLSRLADAARSGVEI